MATAAPALIDLRFAVEDARPLEHAAAPTITFELRIERIGGGRVGGMMLQAQLRIAAARRRYDEETRTRLSDLFGTPEQWSRAIGALHWANTTLVVQRFDDVTVAKLPVPLTYDFEVAAAQWFHAVRDGVAPLEFLFSGTAFYEDGGRLQATLVPWQSEAQYEMPVAVWREAVDAHFPGSAWVRLQRDVFDRLQAYKSAAGLTTFDAAVDELLQKAET